MPTTVFHLFQKFLNCISNKFYWVQLVCSLWHNICLRIFAVLYFKIINTEMLGRG